MGSENYEIAAEELRKDEKKLAQMIKKQEKVLFVSFHLLLNLAEDLQIERKMDGDYLGYIYAHKQHDRKINLLEQLYDSRI